VPRSEARRSRGLLAALALLAGGCGGAGERPGTPPRHLLVITLDTVRADHVTAWGYPRATTHTAVTPEQRASGAALAIDDLAEQGVVFANAFAPRGQTFPSLAAHFTGRAPLATCAIDNEDLLSAGETTLAELLRERGFRTAAFTANPLLAPGSGIEQGFETFECFGMLKTEDRDQLVAQKALRWVGERGPDERLFLWLHLIGPHAPYDPAPFGGVDYASLFTDPAYAGPADGSKEWLDAAYAEQRPLSGEDVNHVVSKYDGEVARANALVRGFLLLYAGVFDAAPSPRWRDTLLVLAADHGEELYQRAGYWGHSKSVYSSVLHVPLVLRHPASLTGKRVIGEVVELQDVLPTLVDWFGAKQPAGVQGRSLLPLVDSYRARSFETRPAFGAWSDRIFTARTARWRLVWNPEGVVPDEEPPGPYPVPKLALFDVVRDPLERFDVAAEHPEVVAELSRALQEWLSDLPACDVDGRGITPERREALLDLGYASAGDSPGARGR
jgi:arylsulfatase A-like enzyme